MSAPARELERLLADAQEAAARLRGAELDRITSELTRRAAELDNRSLSTEELERLRARLHRFRDLCRFVHDTLGYALHGESSYQERGGVQVAGRRPLLVERYG